MPISVNRVTLVGRLGKDPEARGQEGKIVAFTVATSESWKDRNSGDRQEKTEWHSCVSFNEQASNFLKSYCKKGDLVFVEGQLETRKWTDKDGIDRYSTEIVVKPFTGRVMSQKAEGGGRDDSDDRSSGGGRSGGASSGGYGSPNSGFSRDMDDDIPF